MTPMTPEAVEALFTRSDDTFLFARWGRPIATVMFGVEDATIATFKGALEALCVLTGHEMTEMDPELGANMMVFFVRDWAELTAVPDLDRLVPDLHFRFDAEGAILACFAFLRMDENLSAVPAETLALSQGVQAMLLWSDRAFADSSPLALVDGHAVLRPDVADLMRAAYDPAMPAMSRDPAMALRLSARLGRTQ